MAWRTMAAYRHEPRPSRVAVVSPTVTPPDQDADHRSNATTLILRLV